MADGASSPLEQIVGILSTELRTFRPDGTYMTLSKLIKTNYNSGAAYESAPTGTNSTRRIWIQPSPPSPNAAKQTNERKQSLRVTGVARACLVVAVGACCGTVSEAFVPRPWTITNSLTPSPSTKPGPRKVPTKSGAAMMAAKGFGNSPEPSPRASSSKGFEETPVADSGSGGVADWEKEYKVHLEDDSVVLFSAESPSGG